MISQNAKRKENASTSEEFVGPYSLGRCLGKGGFGAVYEGTHQDTGQRVAIKLLHGTKQLEPEVQNRFVREIALLKKLDHENIVHVFDAGLHEDSIYCAMELVDCGTLKDVLVARGSIPWREAAEVGLQVSRALSHAHQIGCVHRDLKPANLYLSEDGLVKLGDLGLARDLNNSRLTTSGQTVGTWRYMPPEQITAEEHIDGRLDIYALGCIMFEMVAGRVPFDGSTFVEIFDQHLESVPPRLDVLVPGCPSEFSDLVDAMLEKKPEDRPENAALLADALEQLLAGNVDSSSLKEITQHKHADTSLLENMSPNLTQRLHSGPIAGAKKPNWRVLIGFLVVVAIIIAIVLALK